jgi:hypothetical protein
MPREKETEVRIEQVTATRTNKIGIRSERSAVLNSDNDGRVGWRSESIGKTLKGRVVAMLLWFSRKGDGIRNAQANGTGCHDWTKT